MRDFLNRLKIGEIVPVFILVRHKKKCNTLKLRELW
jgi:hypothetical protein